MCKYFNALCNEITTLIIGAGIKVSINVFENLTRIYAIEKYYIHCCEFQLHRCINNCIYVVSRNPKVRHYDKIQKQ